MVPYVCPQCGRTAKLPDYCCGSSMASRRSYACRKCSKISPTQQNCCGQPMSLM